MSTITFKCTKERNEELRNGIWEIIREHYFDKVEPNTNVQYEDEGEEVYCQRLNELMKNELCKIEDTDDGICVEFDSTEDAGNSIASEVYGTGMGYCDLGLTYLKPLFNKIVKTFPNITFEADCECYDNWVSEEYHCSYDGENFTTDAEWAEYDDEDDEDFEF